MSEIEVMRAGLETCKDNIGKTVEPMGVVREKHAEAVGHVATGLGHLRDALASFKEAGSSLTDSWNVLSGSADGGVTGVTTLLGQAVVATERIGLESSANEQARNIPPTLAGVVEQVMNVLTWVNHDKATADLYVEGIQELIGIVEEGNVIANLSNEMTGDYPNRVDGLVQGIDTVLDRL